MNSIVRTISCAAVLTALVPAFAQDEEDASAAEVVAEGEEAEKTTENPDRLFHTLPRVREADGLAEVRVPGSEAWTAVERGSYYPLGSFYRTIGAKSKMTVEFGVGCRVLVRGDSSFGTRVQGLGEKIRTVILDGGTIQVKLPRNLPVGTFVVASPNMVVDSGVPNPGAFAIENPAGEARYTYAAKNGDGDETSVRCITGVLSLKGRHYSIPAMHAADEIRIRTSNDGLFTGLDGISGDYNVILDQGLTKTVDFETQEVKIDARTLNWKLSPLTAVRIHRAVPAIGEKLSVAIMTFDAAGRLKNRCAFAEGRPEVNSGELGPSSKKEKEAIAKKAAEATQAVGEGVVSGEDATKTGDSYQDL